MCLPAVRGAAATAALQDCVCQMMTYDRHQRPSARDMLNHDWIREGGVAGDNLIEPEVRGAAVR